MLLGIILLLVVFVIMLYAIAKDVMERSALVLVCAVAAFFVVILIEGAPPTVVVEFLFGTASDGYQNFHAIALIFGIMIISTVCYRTGFFQFIAFQLIKFTRGKPVKVLVMIALLTFLVSSVLADSITAIILIPLTATVCKTLRLNAVPYIVLQMFCIKLGATVLPISSIPSILITASQQISSIEYFTSAGLISFGAVFLTIFLFQPLFHFRLSETSFDEVDVLMKFNPWTFVKDKKMMLISAVTFFSAIAGFIIIPVEILKPDTISFIGAAFLFVINRKNTRQILKEIDFSLLLYLLGVFVVTGSLQYAGLIDLIGQGLTSLNVTNIGIAFLILFWIGAIASAFIDNIPITQIMIPLINILFGPVGTPTAKIGGTGLALGTIWGDNLTPFGDTILPLTIAKNNKVDIQPKDFFKVGAGMTLIIYTVISVVVLFIFDPILGLIILPFILGGLVFIVIIKKRKKGERPSRSSHAVFFKKKDDEEA